MQSPACSTAQHLPRLLCPALQCRAAAACAALQSVPTCRARCCASGTPLSRWWTCRCVPLIVQPVLLFGRLCAEQHAAAQVGLHCGGGRAPGVNVRLMVIIVWQQQPGTRATGGDMETVGPIRPACQPLLLRVPGSPRRGPTSRHTFLPNLNAARFQGLCTQHSTVKPLHLTD